MHDAGSLDRGVDPRLAVRDLAVPGDVDVAQRPGVLERCAGGLRADRRLVVLVAVERRVGGRRGRCSRSSARAGRRGCPASTWCGSRSSKRRPRRKAIDRRPPDRFPVLMDFAWRRDSRAHRSRLRRRAESIPWLCPLFLGLGSADGEDWPFRMSRCQCPVLAVGDQVELFEHDLSDQDLAPGRSYDGLRPMSRGSRLRPLPWSLVVRPGAHLRR